LSKSDTTDDVSEKWIEEFVLSRISDPKDNLSIHIHKVAVSFFIFDRIFSCIL